jgi:hypothetical protein
MLGDSRAEVSGHLDSSRIRERVKVVNDGGAAVSKVEIVKVDR